MNGKQSFAAAFALALTLCTGMAAAEEDTDRAARLREQEARVKNMIELRRGSVAMDPSVSERNSGVDRTARLEQHEKRIIEMIELRREEAARDKSDLPPEEDPTPTATPVDKNKIYGEVVAQIQQETEVLWGRSVGHVIEPRVLDRAQLATLLDNLLGDELQRPEVQGSAEMMRLLELIPADASLGDLYRNLLEGQVGGLFNPSNKALYVVDTFDPHGFLGRVILSHEIGHAIQDAHYPLEDYLQNEKNLDRQKAKQALVEGDATILMIEWAQENFSATAMLGLLAGLESQVTAGLDGTPPALVQDLIFAYVVGAEFCTELMAKWGDDWRRKAFDDPPTSTEQVLHPAKYLAIPREAPVNVTLLPVAPESGFELLFENTLGEWAMRLALTPPNAFPELSALNLKPMISDTTAVEGAAGWGGDRAALYRHNRTGSYLMTWQTVWDTEADAREFRSAFVRRLAMYESLKDATVVEGVVEAEGRRVWLHREGQSVSIVFATSPTGLNAGRKALRP